VKKELNTLYTVRTTKPRTLARDKGSGEDKEMVWANRKQPHTGTQRRRLSQERERRKTDPLRDQKGGRERVVLL
jgi:hypothetical protein